MRRGILPGVAAVVAVCLVAAACGDSSDGGGPDQRAATDAREAADESTEPDEAATEVSPELAEPVARARLATASYAFDRARAEADGYAAITPMMPDMGYHLMNADVTGFDPTQPPILVYLPTDVGGWQLGALEWVFPEEPAEPPFPGAEYGEFDAACHYDDGSFVFADAETDCGTSSPETGASFGFWHPPLVTLHLWAWYPNPDGIFAGTNPLVRPFNGEPAGRAGFCRAGHPC
jgi:hypothetical protein